MTQQAARPSIPESTAIPALVRRLFPLYCLISALATYGFARYATFESDPDGIAYMDMADCLRTHRWAGAVNGIWHPMYSVFLALGRYLFHASLQDETRAYQLVNFVVFLLAMAAATLLVDSVAHLRQTLHPADTHGTFLVDRYALRYLAAGMLVLATQRELAPGVMRPDALLAVFLFAGIAALLRFLATGRMGYAAGMGLALGCAFLTKSIAFPLTLGCIVLLAIFGLLWNKGGARTLFAVAMAVACFAAVAGPFIAALSHQRGRLDFGDSGPLNYAWFAGRTGRLHLQPYMTTQFGSSDVHLKHPQRELLRNPQILSYAELPYGTNPDWFDPAYWYDGVSPHFKLRFALGRFVHNLGLTARFLEMHPQPFVFLTVLLVLPGAALFRRTTPPQQTRTVTHHFWIPTTALALFGWLLYAAVDVQDRYLAVPFMPLMLTVLATLRLRKVPDEPQHSSSRMAACVLALAFGLFATTGSIQLALEQRQEIMAEGLPGGWYPVTMHEAAHALAQLGVRPGDSVACAGTSACLSQFYWARLAGVRILTEIASPRAVAYPFLRDLPNRDEAVAVVRGQGAKVLVADFEGFRVSTSDPFFKDWRQLGNTTLYALPLNPGP